MAKTINGWFFERFGHKCDTRELTGVFVDSGCLHDFTVSNCFEVGNGGGRAYRWDLVCDGVDDRSTLLTEGDCCEYLKTETDEGDIVYLVPYDDGSRTGIYVINEEDWDPVKYLFETGSDGRGTTWSNCLTGNGELLRELEGWVVFKHGGGRGENIKGYRKGKWYFEPDEHHEHSKEPYSSGYHSEKRCWQELHKTIRDNRE